MKGQFIVLFFQFYLLNSTFVTVQSARKGLFKMQKHGRCPWCSFSIIDALAVSANLSGSSPTGPGSPCRPGPPGSVPMPCQCPNHIHVSWLNLPPFAFKNASNNNPNSPVGAFVDAINESLAICCTNTPGKHVTPKIIFDEQPTTNVKELLQKIASMKASAEKSYMALPLTVDDSEKYLGNLESVSVLVSPADVVLVNKSAFEMSEENRLWRSLQGVLLAILLAVLLSLIAGVCIWALETRNNPQNFPRSFAKGTSEGFWWAFVTMSTVGYGDRTPASLLGRLFSVVWIVFGISLCSIVTAAITSGLMTTITEENLVDIKGKEVGVLAGSHSTWNAINNFAIPKVYQDLEDIRNALSREDVEAILVDMYTGLYLLQHSNGALHLGNILKHPHQYGFRFWQRIQEYRNPFPVEVHNCLKTLFMLLETDVRMLIDEYLDKETQNKLKPNESLDLFSINNPFFKTVSIILGVLCGIVVVCGIVEGLYNSEYKTTDQNKAKPTVDQEKVNEGTKSTDYRSRKKRPKNTEEC